MKKTALLIIYLIPLALLMGFVASFSVNFPVHDQWRLVSLFDKVAVGNATFEDFWALHSNHRIVFPKIIITILAFISNWNINYEICLSICFSIVTFAAMYKLSSSQAKNRGDSLFHLANLLTCLWVFSLVQHENWLWGFQLAWFLVNLCVTIAIFILSFESKLLPNFRLSIAAICCGIASFSLAQGLLSWLAVIPSVVAVGGSIAQIRKRLSIWILLFVGTCTLYLIDYHPKRQLSIISLLEKPLVTVNYFFNLLGSPIVRLPVISGLVGLIIFLLFVFFVFHFIKNFITANYDRDRDAAPWLSLGLFSVLSAIFITVGRARFGANHAIESSRYTTVSIFLLIAIIQLWLLFNKENHIVKVRLSQLIYKVFAGILICIIFLNSQQAIAQSQAALSYRQGSKTCLELINYLESSIFFDNSPDSCLWVMTEKTQLVREGAKIIDKIGFRKLAKDVVFTNNPNKIYGYIDNPPTTEKPLIIKKSGTLRVAGWAILPDKLEQPKIALFSYNNQKSLFASAYVNLDSNDVAKALNSNRYKQARWGITLSANYLPIGETTINAWVYNPDGKEFVKLNGSAKIIVEEE
ncbi:MULTISPECIES: hypothetical protein [Kamptonema]|uniref:hypothetical protein n=1 Tax=Kamptonema TaxID=1501433 RepID=UPI0001DAD06F|nr:MULTISPECIES: hypothetical protein [Kamptonema]CBN56453.1 conserved membrane hypothetical protein [Kamptonema sp. PCC 6506]